MRKQALAFAMMSLLAAPPAIAKGASPNGTSGGSVIAQFCKDLAEEGGTPWLSVGECVALNNSSDAERHNFWVHRCDNWRDEGVLELVGFDSFSECIHAD